MKVGLEAAFATLEAAVIECSRESAEKEERVRSLMAAERAVYQQLNAQVASAREAERCQEMRVLSHLAKTNNDEAGPSGGA